MQYSTLINYLKQQPGNKIVELGQLSLMQNDINWITYLKFISSSTVIDKLRNLAIDNLNHNEFTQAEAKLNQLKQIVIYDKQFNEPLFDLNDLSQPITYYQMINELLKFKYFAHQIEDKIKN